MSGILGTNLHKQTIELPIDANISNLGTHPPSSKFAVSQCGADIEKW